MARWSAVCAVCMAMLAGRPLLAEEASNPPVALPPVATAVAAPAAVAPPEASTAVTTPTAPTPTVAPPSTPAPDAEGTVKAALAVQGAGIEIDGTFTAAKDGEFRLAVKPGKHSVVVRQPGFLAVQGAIEVPPGAQVSLSVQTQPYVRDHRPALALMIGGGVLALGAVALDASGSYDALGGDDLHWPMLVGGIASFVGGTLWLKSIRNDEFDPPVGDGRIDVRVSVGPGGARVVGRF
jgi:hypothetical protein